MSAFLDRKKRLSLMSLAPSICGTYSAHAKYKKLDVVACDGAAFIAKSDGAGICPGDDWQLISRQGRQGRPGPKGPRGDKGDRGEPGATIRSWQVDRERYRVSPSWTDAQVGPSMELRSMFEHFLIETGGRDE
jgi:hypothetical protein